MKVVPKILRELKELNIISFHQQAQTKVLGIIVIGMIEKQEKVFVLCALCLLYEGFDREEFFCDVLCDDENPSDQANFVTRSWHDSCWSQFYTLYVCPG
jgi:hypothetical protein